MEKRDKIRRWFVLLCAFLSMAIFGGTYRSFGVLLVEWREYFDASSAQVSAVITVLAASGLLSGIPSGIVISKYGCHYGGLMGGIAFVTGTLTSVFAPSPLVLCFTTGFITGMGVAVRNSALVSVAHVFKKGYFRANGLAMAGGSVGMMLVPPLLQLCIDRYGWRGALLILVGIQLHLFVAALIFRPPRRGNLTKEGGENTSEQVARSDKNNDEECEPLRSVQFDDSQRISSKESADSPQGTCSDQKVSTDTNSLGETLGKDSVELHDIVNDKDAKFDGTHPIEIDERQTEQPTAEDTKTTFKRDCEDADQSIHTENNPINKENSKIPHKTHRDSRSYPDLKESELLMNVSDEVTIDEPHHELPPESTRRRPSRVQQGLESTGLSLFCNNIGFCLFNLCQVFIGLCYTGILTHLVASAVYDGIDQQSASFLLSVFGISNMFARIGSGWVVDLKFLSPEHIYVVAVVAFGVTMILSRAWNTYGWYVFVALLFGLSSGLFKTLNPVVLKKYVGMEYFARAIGVFYGSTGAGDLLGPIFAGALYDASNSYDLPFYVAGSVLIVSSGLLLLEPPLRRLKERRHQKMKEMRESDETAV